MTTAFGDFSYAWSTPWAIVHPGRAALVTAAATYAGLACVVVGLAEAADGSRSGVLGQFWEVVLVVCGAAMFVAALPASLGFAGASCATDRDLWSGVIGGFASILLTLVVIAMVLPVRGYG